MQAEAAAPPDVSEQNVAFKRSLAPRRAALDRAFAEITDHVDREVEEIRAKSAAGKPVISEIALEHIHAGKVPPEAGALVRKHGCVIVRGVFVSATASAWFDEVGADLDINHYEERWASRKSRDDYFDEVKVKGGRQQMYNVFWSKPQVMARQDPRLAEIRSFGDVNAGPDYASVIYIGAVPDCPKNRAYIEHRRPTFLDGRSPPDYAAMDFEVDFKGRATIDDLTPLGRAQMGL